MGEQAITETGRDEGVPECHFDCDPYNTLSKT